MSRAIDSVNRCHEGVVVILPTDVQPLGDQPIVGPPRVIVSRPGVLHLRGSDKPFLLRPTAVDALPARGRGLRLALLRYALMLARQVADDFGAVGVVVDARPQALRFYQRFGFEARTGFEEGLIRTIAWWRDRERRAGR